MTTNFFVVERRVSKKRLLDFIQNNPNLLERKLKGLFSLSTGQSFKVIERYLDELEAANLIEKEDEKWKIVS